MNAEYDMRRELHKFGIDPKSLGLKCLYPNARIELKKSYNAIKPAWVSTNNGTATQEAFDNLGRAMQRYWDIATGKITVPKPKKPRKDGYPLGWPTWRKARIHNSFRVTNVSLSVWDKYIQYNKREVGPIRMCESVRFAGDIQNATFSFDGLHWWASVLVKTAVTIPEHNDMAVGVDLGVRYLASTSNGRDPFENPKAYYDALSKLRRLQRNWDRMKYANNPDSFDEKGRHIPGKEIVWSNNMKNLDQKIKKLHRRVKNIRQNSSHQMTAELTNDYGIICLEDLNVSGMLKNKKLSKAINDAAFFEKKRQFVYKSKRKGGVTVCVDRWYPSSKTCNSCGWVYAELEQGESEWICLDCGSVNERDENAAKNLRDEGLRILYNGN